jgi:importin subunit beta-1
MQKIFQVTLETISKGDGDGDDEQEDLCKFAIEFWQTICEEELSNQEEIEYNTDNNIPIPPECVVHHFVKGALQALVPLLTKCLTLQDGDEDPDDYTIPMAASMCLSNIARTVKDDIVPFIMPFVEQNILSPEWQKREAAVNSFGSILDGPKGVIPQLILQAAPVLLKHLKDPNAAVKETSVWTIATILRLHPESTVTFGEVMLRTLCETLGDPSPRVAGRACLGIHNFALAFQEEATNPIGKFFVDVVRMLLLCADRLDANAQNLRTSAYEALSIVLDSAPPSIDENLVQVLKIMLERLEKTFAMDILSQDDQNNQIDLQQLLCGVIQVLVGRLGKQLKPYTDTIMQQLINLFRSKKDATHCFEEGMLTVNAVVAVSEGDFNRYMPDLLPHLLTGMGNWQAHQVCNIAVGVVGDIARALGPNMVPHCDKIITVLLTNLQNRDLDRAVKPTILSVFGDIAWSIGGGFEKYLQIVMHMLKQAADTVIKTNIPDDDYDLIDYLNLLREGICEAYTGISQGLRADGKGEKLFGSLNDIMQFILHIATEKQCNESVRRGACGIIGDLILIFQSRVKSAVQHAAIQRLLLECQSNTTEYAKETNDVAAWARQLSNQI